MSTPTQSVRLPRANDVRMSCHAVERFRERAASGIGSMEAAERMLYEQLSNRRATTEPPSWMRYHRDADAWLSVGRIALPLMRDHRGRWKAVTLLHYSMMKLSDSELERRRGGPRRPRL